MNKPTVYILIGVPASGKSTWAYDQSIAVISRDCIRFSLIEEQTSEKYFSKEKEVFSQFGKLVADALLNGQDVIADATHISKKSRNKIIKELDKYIQDYKIIFVNFIVPIEMCIERDHTRGGLVQVGEKVIKNIFNNYEKPSREEDNRITAIWTITTEVE